LHLYGGAGNQIFDFGGKIMKFTIISLLLLSFMWQGQTTEPMKEVSLDEEFTIKIGQQVEVKEANLKITLTSVQEDSRCPVDVDCVWAGNAKLNLEVKRSKKKFVSASLNTTLNPREIHYKGYTIKLIRLSPERRASVPVDSNDYEATIVVSAR
jgi:hypothetical protein